MIQVKGVALGVDHGEDAAKMFPDVVRSLWPVAEDDNVTRYLMNFL